MTKRVAILISGGGSNMVSLVKIMQQDAQCNAKPVLVLANSDTAGGLAKAADLGVDTQVVDHRPFKGDRVAFEAVLHDVIEKYSPDIICLAGFMRVLTPSFIDKWTGKMLNIHPSLLPKYKGLHTHQRAIDARDMVAGCSIHVVTSELDGGPVLAQAKVAITPDDTADTLAAKVLVQEHKLYPAALKEFVRV
ncbi:MAG: phosphoribosylglycinamide formyltransferase [Rhodobacteraceae bacterium]|nr:MAG: phosphoribosylglycinamide formyltransferase [Paracoccaceae bacterium]